MVVVASLSREIDKTSLIASEFVLVSDVFHCLPRAMLIRI